MNKHIPIAVLNLVLMAGCSGFMPELGVNNGQLKPCPKTPNCVSSQASDKRHFVAPIQFSGTQKDARARLLQILRSEKRAKILTVQENYIRAEFTSAVFRFVDDVEFSFPAAEGEASVIHIRSASRVGYSDLGVNRKRIERIRREF